jgi:hypothetical protein
MRVASYLFPGGTEIGLGFFLCMMCASWSVVDNGGAFSLRRLAEQEAGSRFGFSPGRWEDLEILRGHVHGLSVERTMWHIC